MVNVVTYRIVAMLFLFIGNFLLVKLFPLNEIGLFYTVMAIAYFGNAIVLVGCDLYLQSKIKKSSISLKLNIKEIIIFYFKTVWIGAILVSFLALTYFFVTDEDNVNIFLSVLICLLLSASLYLSAMVKNIMQVSALSKPFLYFLMMENGFKFLIIAMLGNLEVYSAIELILCMVIISIIQSILFIFYIEKVTNNCSKKYFRSYKTLCIKILPIGTSGLLNWGHLQAYKPVAPMFGMPVSDVGTLSYLSSLGASAANAIISLIYQITLPKVYSENGDNINCFIRKLVFTGVFLCVTSVPCAVLFISLTGKEQLSSYYWLVTVGVFIEVGNSIVGAVSIFGNIKSMALLNNIAKYNLVGLLLFVSFCFTVQHLWDEFILSVSVSLVLSQFCVCLLCLVNLSQILNQRDFAHE